MYYNGIQSYDECKPLDDLTIPHMQHGNLVHVPALHEGWATPRLYLSYFPPPQQQPDGSFQMGAKEDWLDTMKFYCKDLEWLLDLEHYRFWSQIVHDGCAMEMIVSFLQEGYSSYMIHEFPSDDEMWNMYQRIYHLVFLVINRLATHTESKTAYMTSKYLGELIYNNYIFSISILIDLCLLYRQENRKQLTHIIKTVFEVQPQYQNDLAKAVGCITQVLLGVSVQLDVPLQSSAVIPTRLKSTKNTLTLEGLSDLILYVLDTAMGISSLLDIYTPGCTTFHQQLFELRIVSFYENTIPELYRKLELLANKQDCQWMYNNLKKKLAITRVELLKAFRYIISSCINDVFEKKDILSPTEIKASVDDYVNVLSECLGEKRFVQDYHKKYPLDHDLDMLAQICPEMDKLKTDYLFESVLTCFDVQAPKKQKPVKEKTDNVMSGVPYKKTEEIPAIQKQKVSGVRLESLITQVKDLLPHLGEGFLEQCLEYYDYSCDGVVNAVLENQLPPELQAMDYTMPRIPPEVEEMKNMDGLELEEEEDELNNVDYTKSHRGKRKGPYRDLRQMMNDKSHREEFRDLYSRLGIVDSEDIVYDDEYDDAYDHLDVSVEDGGDLERRPFVVPRVLRQKENSESSDGEEDDNDEVESGPVRDHFVPNPEELRAQAEQRRLSRQPNKPRSNDVVGRAKGHGQEKQVTVNRSNKNVNKSFHGNHNRRRGAQHKRNQGMLPS